MDDILLHIVGYREYGEDIEGIEFTTAGKIQKNGSEVILEYDDTKMIENEHVTTNIIVNKDSIIMINKGAVETQLVFETEKTFTTKYKTPFGEMDLTLYPTLVGTSENDKGGKIELEYVTNISGIHVVNRLDVCYFTDSMAVRA